MANRYVDLSGDWESTQTGADHVGNEWKGPYGLQKAGDIVNAGDTVYIKGTADMRRLCILNLGKDIVAAGWVPGDTLKDNNTGLEWEGVYAENINTTSIVIELIAGDVYADIIIGSGVNNVTKVDNTTIPSKANTFQLSLDKTAGVIDNIICYLGVNAVWANDSTRCVFDGHGTNGASMYLLKATMNYCRFENIEFDDSDYAGFLVDGDYCLYKNLYAHHCDAFGFFSDNGCYSCYYKCICKDNGNRGFYSDQHNLIFIGCVTIGNSSYGFDMSAGNNHKIFSCIAHDNLIGFQLNNTTSILINCVSDGNLNQGMCVKGFASLVFGCRLTNNGQYGLYQMGGGFTFEFFNFLLSNTLGAYYEPANSRIDKVDGSLTAGTEGYNDRPNDDFNLTTAASLRRSELALPND